MVSFSFYKVLIPPRGPTLLTLLNLINFPKSSSPNSITLDIRASAYEFGGEQTSSPQQPVCYRQVRFFNVVSLFQVISST